MAGLNKVTAPVKTGGISLAPSTFTQGGGLLDDADVEVIDAAFCLWDYNGSVKPDVPALGLSLRRLEGGQPSPKDGTESGFDDNDQYYSCGSPDAFVPNEDGTGLKPVGDKTSIVNSTNAALLLASMVNCGLPEDVLASGNIKDLVGLRMHVNRMEQPKKGGNKEGFQGGKDPNKKQEVLVCTKIISLPGETQAATKGPVVVSKTGTAKAKTNSSPVQTATKPPANAATAQSASASGGFDAENPLHAVAQASVLAVLMENDGSVLRKDLAPKVFQSFEKGDKGAPAIMKLAFDEGFLKGGMEAGAGWQYDGTTVSIG